VFLLPLDIGEGSENTVPQLPQRVILSVSEESFTGTIPVLRLSGEDPSSPAAPQDDKSGTFSVVSDPPPASS